MSDGTIDPELTQKTGAESTGNEIPFDSAPPPPLVVRADDLAPQNINWPAIAIGSLALISGVLGIVQPLLMRLSEHPRLYSMLVPFELYHWTKSVSTGFSFLLIYLSLNLFRGKRIAWMLSTVLVIGLIAVELARFGSEHFHFIGSQLQLAGLPQYSVVPYVVLLGALIIWRRRFTVMSEFQSIKKAFVAGCFFILVVIAYGALGFWLLDTRDLGVNFEFGQAFICTLRELTLIGNVNLVPHTEFGKWFLSSLDTMGALAGVFVVYNLFRPLHYSQVILPQERAVARTLLEKYGRTSLDRYTIFSDKSFFFSSDRKAYISYSVAKSVAIGLSDPIGDPDSIQLVITEFAGACHKNDWQIAFLQTTPDLLPQYKAANLQILKIGEDAIVDLDQFVTKTASKKTFKAPAKKFERDGFKLEKLEPPHSSEVLNELEQVSDQWLSLPGRRERGFSLGWFDAEDLQNDIVFALKDPSGKIIAFVNQVRSYKPGEVTIDLMRHRVDVPASSMDFLFVKLLQALKKDGFQKFSLGLAALSGVGDSPEDSLEEKAAHLVYERLNKFFSFKGLRAYKSKFDPEWVDRFLVYERGPAGLLKTAYALNVIAER